MALFQSRRSSGLVLRWVTIFVSCRLSLESWGCEPQCSQTGDSEARGFVAVSCSLGMWTPPDASPRPSPSTSATIHRVLLSTTHTRTPQHRTRANCPRPVFLWPCGFCLVHTFPGPPHCRPSLRDSGSPPVRVLSPGWGRGVPEGVQQGSDFWIFCTSEVHKRKLE